VVSEKQRETIYGIQAEYAAKIEVLETQLKTLKAERDKRMAAVLTAEQQKKVEDATAKARTKRAKPVEQAAASKASAIKSGPDR
jgi:Spy/CpxP family protein refolding chaperone